VRKIVTSLWRIAPYCFGEIHSKLVRMINRCVGLNERERYNRGLLIRPEENPSPMPRIFRALLTAACLLPGLAMADGDPTAGETKAYTCTGCHGIPGYNNVYPTYKVPKIGGQNYEYLVIALKAYRSGERDHPTMELQAQSLSDQDIEDVASYFAEFHGEEAAR
jgi:cytochrome c553